MITETQEKKMEYQKRRYQEIPALHLKYQKRSYQENSKIKREIEKSYRIKKTEIQKIDQKMQCPKVRQVLPYHVQNKLLSSEKRGHHGLLLFYQFRDEKELLPGFPRMYRNKLQREKISML